MFLLVLTLAILAMAPIALAQTPPSAVPDAPAAASFTDEVARLESIREKIEHSTRVLHDRVRLALDLRRNISLGGESGTGSWQDSGSTARDNREEQLTLQIAQLRQYKMSLIYIYDVVTDENPNTYTDSINWNLNQFLDGAARLAAWNTVERQAASQDVRTRASAIEVQAQRVAERLQSPAGSRRLVLVPRSLFQEAGVNGTPSANSEQEALIADTTRHAPAFFLADPSTLPKDSRFAVVFGRDFLQTLQAAIDPAERAEFAAIHEQAQVMAARLLDMDVQASGGAEEAAEPVAENEPARIESRIHKSQQYRESLIGAFRGSVRRMVGQLRALGREDAEVEGLKLIESPENARTLSEESTQELIRILKDTVHDLARANSNGNPHATQKSLTEELAAWEALLNDLAARAAAIEATSPLRRAMENRRHLLTMQDLGKRLRLQNLNESISRDEALAQVAVARVGTAVQGVALIDERIAALDKQWSSAALKFYSWAAAKVLVILLAAWLLIRVLKVIANRIVTSFTARVAAETGEEETDPERIRDLTQRAKTLSGVFMAAVRIVVWVTALLMVMGQFDVNYQPLLLATGGITLAIGFGAQSLVKDFFSGFFILLENQFQVGDVVELGGDTGTVESVSLRTTRLRAGDGSVHIVPNGEIKAVTNQTHGWSRIMFNVGVGYNEDPDEVKALLNNVGREMFESPEWKSKLLEAPMVMGLDNFGASSLDFRIMGRTRPGEQWAATRELRRRIKIAFDLGGIEIPYNYVNYREVGEQHSKLIDRLKEGREIAEAKAPEPAPEPGGKRKLRAADGGMD